MEPRYALVEFAGPDALTFLQAQLATDLRRVDDLRWQWAALCAIDGRAVATGALIRASAQQWLWLLRADLAPALAEHLRKFQLRSKLTIEPPKPAYLRAEKRIPRPDLDQQLQRIERIDQEQWLLVNLPQGWSLTVSTVDADENVNGLMDWEDARLSRGMLMINHLCSGEHLALALELHRLRAVSVSKGCYPGQEIIARTHYRGKSKRSLALLDAAPSSLQVGDRVEAEGQTIGTVLEIAQSGLALAEVSTSAFASKQWTCGGTDLSWRTPDLPEPASTQLTGNS
ncbi:MAG: folate-binding protein YgfZ [Xanthomonadales bacterium]|nr:folate-binding protein YgfZ [Xanthomonadales bacterium]